MEGKMKFIRLFCVMVALLFLGTFALARTVGAGDGALADHDSLALISEETGLVATLTPTGPDCQFSEGHNVYLCQPSASTHSLQRDPAAAALARQMLNTTGLLLIPESSNRRVMAFDPITGDLVDANFIPADTVNLSTPIHAILSAAGNTILLSDQIRDVVQEYDLDGNFLGTFAPAGGVNTNILDNIRGMALRPNGNLLVTVASGPNTHSVAEFDTNGVYLGNFVANGAGGLAGPWDIYQRSGDWLVSNSTSPQALRRYHLTTGDFLSLLVSISSFPEQIDEAANSNILVANFSGQQGVLEYTAAGAFVALYNVITGNRGVHELPNGNILTTSGNGVFEISRSNTLVSTKISGVSARFIEYIQPPAEETIDAYVARMSLRGRETWKGEIQLQGQTLIRDIDGNRLPGADVHATLTFPDGSSVNDVSTTDGNGIAVFNMIGTTSGMYTLTVTNIVMSGYTFNSEMGTPARSVMVTPYVTSTDSGAQALD
jgi:hypothetical protein